MLFLKGFKFLSKVESIFDSLETPKTKMKIVVDGGFEIPEIEGQTAKNITTWQDGIIPPIQLSPYQKSIPIQFAIYQQGSLIGLGKSLLQYKIDRRDLIEILNEHNFTSGKLYFEVKWVEGIQMGQFVSFQQYNTLKDAGKNKSRNEIIPKNIKRDQKVYVKAQGDQDCGGFCGCFAVKKKRQPKPQPEYKQKDTPITPKMNSYNKIEKETRNGQIIGSMIPSKFRYQPLIYFEDELESGQSGTSQLARQLVYYSKGVYRSN